MATILVTGFPGFLGAALVPHLLERAPGDRALCLVQERWMDAARRRITQIDAEHPGLAPRIELVPGDITRRGLTEAALPFADITQAHHLAAVYDLAVPRDVGMRVNVEGTRNVLDALERCPKLERLHYVSTCYVSGRHPGLFREADLQCGQTFNNFYEETKHLAEVLVRERMHGGLPATIYRPAIVVGDSRTGETQKYDGPYGVARALLKQPRRLAIMPRFAGIDTTFMTVVPREYVIQSIAHLSGLDRSLGRTYQLTGPNPPTIRETIDTFARVTGRRVVLVPTPMPVAKAAMRRISWFGVQPESLDYFTHPTTYDTSNTTADLEGSGISAPPFADYAQRLIDFMVSHTEFTAAGMV